MSGLPDEAPAACAQAVEMKKSMSFLCEGRHPARLGRAIMAQRP
jgi:hypothetical protein